MLTVQQLAYFRDTYLELPPLIHNSHNFLEILDRTVAAEDTERINGLLNRIVNFSKFLQVTFSHFAQSL
jgi:hypothetical protein